MTQPPPGPGWPQGPYPPPGYPQQGYPPPGYPQPSYPPPGYPQPGYPPQDYPPQNYPHQGYPQQSHPGYPPPGYPGMPPIAMQPGIIPLRPLTLSDIFNGAARYVRTNPKATLGLAAVVVIVTQVLALILQIGPLAALGELDALSGEVDTTAAMVGTIATALASGLMQALATVVLSGMLTVVVGRAVFGSSITIGEAWSKIRGRILPLLGLALLEALGAVILVGVVAGIVVGLGAATDWIVAVIVGIPLGLGLIAALLYLGTALSFAPVAVVLERAPVLPAIRRSFFLVRHDFLRILGIRLLAGIVVLAIATAVGMPFALAQIFAGMDTTSGVLVGTVLTTVGTIVGQVITAPFSAGVVVLLYTDRRIRAEAFDLALRTGAAGGPAAVESTDNLWLARH
ncbi:membrane protein [soil metagenome]